MREPYWPIPERRSSGTMDSRITTTPGAPRPDFRTWISAPARSGGKLDFSRTEKRWLYIRARLLVVP